MNRPVTVGCVDVTSSYVSREVHVMQQCGVSEELRRTHGGDFSRKHKCPNYNLLLLYRYFQRCLAVRGGHQGSAGVVMGDGVSLTRKHVWMFHLSHPADWPLAKASPKVIKDMNKQRDTRGTVKEAQRRKEGKWALGTRQGFYTMILKS